MLKEEKEDVRLILEGKDCGHITKRIREGNYFKVGQFDNVYCFACQNTLSFCIRKIEKKNYKGMWV